MQANNFILICTNSIICDSDSAILHLIEETTIVSRPVKKVDPFRWKVSPAVLHLLWFVLGKINNQIQVCSLSSPITMSLLTLSLQHTRNESHVSVSFRLKFFLNYALYSCDEST